MLFEERGISATVANLSPKLEARLGTIQGLVLFTGRTYIDIIYERLFLQFGQLRSKWGTHFTFSSASLNTVTTIKKNSSMKIISGREAVDTSGEALPLFLKILTLF
jgi:hypothetical protein